MPATATTASRKKAAPPELPSDLPADLPVLDKARLYRIPHAAKYLAVSPRHVYKMIADGRIRPVDLGVLRIPGAEIERIANQGIAEDAGHA